MQPQSECSDCAGSGEICAGCWAPSDWCDCEKGDAAPRVMACNTCRDEPVELPLVAAA